MGNGEAMDGDCGGEISGEEEAIAFGGGETGEVDGEAGVRVVYLER